MPPDGGGDDSARDESPANDDSPVEDTFSFGDSAGTETDDAGSDRDVSAGPDGASDESRSDGDDPGSVAPSGDAGRRGDGSEATGQSERGAASQQRNDGAGSGVDTESDVGPSRRRDSTPPDPTAGPVDAVRWFLTVPDGPVAFVREMAGSVVFVLAIGFGLFLLSGVWPPMVAVQSGSMQPHLQPGDLVFIVEEHRYGDRGHADTGVVTAESGTASTFGKHGDVIVFAPPGRSGPPIIHRAMFWVADGENWYDEANPEYISATACEAPRPSDDLRNCPATHAGFITKGDHNSRYDQANGLVEPVRPRWVRGTAEIRVPVLGCVRLWFAGNPPPACRP